MGTQILGTQSCSSSYYINSHVIPGPTGNDGSLCPVACPPPCPLNHKQCPGDFDMNGCASVSEPIGLDGSKCYVACPTSPPADHTVCPGGFDTNGCPMPDTYIPTTGTYINKSTSTLKVIMKSI